MTKLQIKKIISAAACALACAVFIVVMYFCAPTVPVAPETTGEFSYSYGYRDENDKFVPAQKDIVVGKDITAVRISDISDLQKITEVNYIPDKFVNPGTLEHDFQLVDLTKPFEFAKKGTLMFVILNLNPFAEDFDDQANRLNEYKIGDYWRFTFRLPKIFSAANVYNKSELVARHGEIENYDFIDYTTSYDKKTTDFSTETESTDIALTFYTRREIITNTANSAKIITVHYQSDGGAYSGIKEMPMIGVENKIESLTDNSQSLLIAFAVIAFVVFSIFGVLSLLKRTADFVPALTYIFGIAAMLFSRFILTGTATVPLMWVAISLAAPFAVLAGALLLMSPRQKKPYVKYILCALPVMGALFAFICPFVSYGAAQGLTVTCSVIRGVCAAALLGFIGIYTAQKHTGVLSGVCATVIAVAFVAALFLPQITPAYYNPMFWMCVITVVATFAHVFIVVRDTELTNVYLTENMQKEIDRQVKDIKAIITERDRLLQFVSHDMKKPLMSSLSLIDTAIEREKDAEQLKTLGIIKQNDSRVISNLSEIGAFAKFNYIAEPSQTVDLMELCALLFKYHQLDCNANGIVLKNSVEKSYPVFVKKQGLESVISNIIMNAVEHAHCNAVTISVRPEKNKTVLCIADNGTGISKDMDVFKAYITEKPAHKADETDGVGLYICKNVIESMNGDLSYESDEKGTTFFISLLKA